MSIFHVEGKIFTITIRGSDRGNTFCSGKGPITEQPKIR